MSGGGASSHQQSQMAPKGNYKLALLGCPTDALSGCWNRNASMEECMSGNKVPSATPYMGGSGGGISHD